MLIERHNTFCKVNTTDPAVHAFLDAKFSEYVKGYFFNPLYQKRQWDGKYHAYSRMTGKFRSGLLKSVVEALKSDDMQVRVRDVRTAPVLGKPVCPALMHTLIEGFRELRDYQLESVDIMIKETMGVIKAATNAGKSEMFCEFIRRTNLKALIICTRKELFHQTAERLSIRLGVPIGKVGDGCHSVENITVVMPSTAVKSVATKGKKSKPAVQPQYECLLNYDILLLDECQNLGDSRVELMVNKSTAYYRFAFSGTPYLKDKASNLQLEGEFGRVIVEISNQELITQGISSVPRCFFIKSESDDLVGAPYDVAYSAGVVYSTERNARVVEMARMLRNECNKRVLIICSQVEHCEILAAELPEAEVVHGSSTSKHRMDVLKRIKLTGIDMLITTTIYDEGVDTAHIDSIIMAAGMMTPERILQRIGRGLRAKESMSFWYCDFLDTGNGYLAEHSAKRVQLLKSEGFKVELLQPSDIVNLKDKLQHNSNITVLRPYIRIY